MIDFIANYSKLKLSEFLKSYVFNFDKWQWLQNFSSRYSDILNRKSIL